MDSRIPFRMTEPNHSIYLFCLQPLQRQNPGVRKKINEWILLQSVQNIWELICLYLTEKRCGKWQLFSACYLQWCTNWVTFSRGQNKKPLWTSYRTFNYTRTPKLCRYTVICLTTGTRFPGFYWDRFCSRVAGCTRPRLSPASQPGRFGSSLSQMISATTNRRDFEDPIRMTWTIKGIKDTQCNKSPMFSYLSKFAVVFAGDMEFLAFGRAVKGPCKGFIPFRSCASGYNLCMKSCKLGQQCLHPIKLECSKPASQV